jgi:predicted amidophosphoribosyltransferase
MPARLEPAWPALFNKRSTAANPVFIDACLAHMICKTCGTEIADKALICYRCGAPVEEAVTKPAPLRRKRPVVVYLVLAVLIAIALLRLWLR